MIEHSLTQLLLQIASQELTKLANNPQAINGFLEFLGAGCHNAVDVAQDALDAYDHGHLTRDQAMRIVEICLEKDARQKGKPIDIQSKRIEIEQLFTR
jgi:hypothetical protein